MYPKEIIRDTEQNLEPTYRRPAAPTGCSTHRQLTSELWFPPLPFVYASHLEAKRQLPFIITFALLI